ncbi:hypothetical protein SAMN05421636_10456 [Pricia antarctica]|uniref:Uncharacterized protein n=1 Tax=Pricia antarctica TaxID=641691 RepID=A0A1G7B9K5_9FLAO|nr:hypothetical protein [Pricia antarctica]SDE23500.1 hypothetical protein SAMN05421636_10456 [Pricia antarctica]
MQNKHTSEFNKLNTGVHNKWEKNVGDDQSIMAISRVGKTFFRINQDTRLVEKNEEA